MENELTLFQDFDDQENSTLQYIAKLDCYAGLPQESIDRLEGYASDIHHIANKASFGIAQKLCDAREEYSHNKHGGFEGWIDEKLKIGHRTAYNMIYRYEQFSNVENLEQLDIALTAQYKLAQPGTQQEARKEAIERAESGEKITIAKANGLIEKWQRIAEDNKKQAEEAQRQLSIFQSRSRLAQGKIDELTNQIAELEEKLRVVEIPEKIEVIPQITLDKITNLESLVKKQKEQNKQLTNRIDILSTDLEKQRDANEARRKQEQYEFGIKDAWKKATDAFYKALSQFVGQFPSPIATQVFDANDWARYDQIDQALKHFDEAFANIKATRYSNQFIDASIDVTGPSDKVMTTILAKYDLVEQNDETR